MKSVIIRDNKGMLIIKIKDTKNGVIIDQLSSTQGQLEITVVTDNNHRITKWGNV